MEKKLALLPALLALGCLIAGGYGALHDQISYSIPPEYFHSFKFDQFGIPEGSRNRLGASMVGWYATWWMGLLTGVPVFLVGLVMPDRRTYFTRSLMAITVVVSTALVVGLLGLTWAGRGITDSSLPGNMDIPANVADPVSFARVGTMHNFSYLGGFLGIFAASVLLLGERLRLSARHPAHLLPPGAVRMTVATCLICVAPFAMASVYMLAAHGTRSSEYGLASLAACLCSGVLGVALLPMPRVSRVCAAIAYIPLMAFALINYCLTFAGLVFGEWL